MFGFDLSQIGAKLLDAINTPLRALAGAAFITLALASIEYDEVIAPELTRISSAWGGTAAEFSRRLSSFTL